MVMIRNIKVSLKSKAIALNNVRDILKQKEYQYKDYPNFISFNNTFVYVIFKTSHNNLNHINVSRLLSLNDLQKCIEIFEEIFSVPVLHSTVDNIVATAKHRSRINLYDVVKKRLFNNIRYNPEQFPGVFIKSQKGTIIIFHSGKIVSVGCKLLDDVECVTKEIIAKLETLF